jgi:hypothetical protein
MLPNYKPTIYVVTPFQRVAFKARDVVEVVGPFGSAKLEFLLHVCTNLAKVLFQVEGLKPTHTLASN